MRFIFKNTVILAATLICMGTALASTTNVKSRSLGNKTIQYQAQLTETSSDLNLFIKAIRQFLSQKRYQIASKVKIFGSFSGGELSFFLQNQTVVDAPNRFNSKIAFTNTEGEVGKQYNIISDGNQVWVHDLNNNLYSVTNYENFSNSSDGIWVGLFSSIFLEVRENLEDLDILLSLSEEQLLEALATELGAEINEIGYGIETLEETEYKTYKYIDLEEGFTLTTFVNPVTAKVEHLQINGQENGIDITMQESIADIDQLSFVSASKFRFVPPFEAQKSDEIISIEPF